MRPLALLPEDDEQFERPGADVGDGVGRPSVKFRGLAGAHVKVLVGQSEPHLPGKHIDPLVSATRSGEAAGISTALTVAVAFPLLALLLFAIWARRITTR